MKTPDETKPLFVVTANTHGLWGKAEKYTYKESYFGSQMWLPSKKTLDDCFDSSEITLGLNTKDYGLFRFITHDKKEAETFYLGAKSAIQLLSGLFNSIK